jgi:phenylalanyl-tRNA synthetase alpha chain
VEEILSLKKSFLIDAESTASLSDLQQLKLKYLGKKGLVTAKLKALSSVPPEARPAYGKTVNEIKGFIDEEIGRRESALKLKEHEKSIISDAIDIICGQVTFGKGIRLQVLSEITAIFVSWFRHRGRPEVEHDYIILS